MNLLLCIFLVVIVGFLSYVAGETTGAIKERKKLEFIWRSKR